MRLEFVRYDQAKNSLDRAAVVPHVSAQYGSHQSATKASGMTLRTRFSMRASTPGGGFRMVEVWRLDFARIESGT